MQGQFTSIPNTLFLDKRLPRNCILIYGVLQSYANIFGEVHPKYETIAIQTGLNRATVIRLMKRLVLYGYVIKEKGFFKKDNIETGKQGANCYYLNPNPTILCAKNVDKSPIYPQVESQNATDDQSQSATPKRNMYDKKNMSVKDNIIYLPIHARKSPDETGGDGIHQSHCGNIEKNIGQCSTKKLTSAFDSLDAIQSVENYMQKKGG